jgi:DNA-binding NarL/FixJ family response regulator
MGALAQHPAAIVLDLSLPDGDGIELLRAVRETGCRSKVAVLSSGASSTSLAELTALQPDAIFGKPLDFEDFAEWLAANFQGFGGPKAIEPVIKQIERRATYSRAA